MRGMVAFGAGVLLTSFFLRLGMEHKVSIVLVSWRLCKVTGVSVSALSFATEYVFSLLPFSLGRLASSRV